MANDGLFKDGCVVVEDGRVVAVDHFRRIDPPHVDHDIDGLLTPGLINAHTHLELTNVSRPTDPKTFQDWLLTTMASVREPDIATFNAKRVAAVNEGIAQCLKFGVTCVGDISQNVGIVRPLLKASPLRAISFGECLGIGPRRPRFEALLREAVLDTPHVGRLHTGISPHAPYTVDSAGYVESFHAMFGNLDREWTTHLAETPDELPFIRDRAGPFKDLYQRLGFDPGPPESTEAKSPVEWLYRLIGEAPGTLLAHVNFCSDEDLDWLVKLQAMVVWCPRTHAYFGHPPHRWREMIARGIPVCVGTDSCASSPDLNIIDDLRLLRQQHPELPPVELWKLVTTNAGMPFVWADTLWPGQLEADETIADMVAWPTRSDDPLAEVLDTPGMLPSHVWTS